MLVAKQINLQRKSTIEENNLNLQTPQNLYKDNQNIFSSIPTSKDFKTNFGPRYNEQGEILKYSVVGKPDWFQKHYIVHIKKAQLEDQLKSGGKQQQNEEKQSVFRKSRISGYDSISKKITSSERKINLKKKEQLRTKNQLLDEIDNIKKRLDSNHVKEEDYFKFYIQHLKFKSKLPENTRRIFEKQSLVLEKYQNSVRDWDLFIQKCASRLERDSQQTMMVKQDNYRLVKETAQSIDILKSEFERFGPNIWYMTLRRNQKIPQSQQLEPIKVDFGENLGDVVNEDLPRAFHNSTLANIRASLEYIRKPIIQPQCYNRNSNSISSFNTLTRGLSQTSSLPYQSFHSDQYLLKKINSLQQSVEEHHMITIDNANEIETMYVQGQSQFQREVEQILQDKESNQTLYKKFPQIQEPNAIKQVEEIIQENYSKMQKLKLPSLGLKKKQRNNKLKSDKSLSPLSNQSMSDG